MAITLSTTDVTTMTTEELKTELDYLGTFHNCEPAHDFSGESCTRDEFYERNRIVSEEYGQR